MSAAPPGRGSWVLLIPFAGLLFLILAAVGWYVAIQIGGAAHGEEVDLLVRTECPAGRQAIRDRLDAYGLPVATETASGFRIQLPGMADDREHMPRALGAPGHLVVTVDGQPMEATVRHVGVQMALSGQPVTLFTLDQELAAGEVAVHLDDAPMEVEAVNGGEVQIRAQAEDGAAALRLASDRAVQLRFPLPCVVQVDLAPPG